MIKMNDGILMNADEYPLISIDGLANFAGIIAPRYSEQLPRAIVFSGKPISTLSSKEQDKILKAYKNLLGIESCSYELDERDTVGLFGIEEIAEQNYYKEIRTPVIIRERK